LGFVEAKSDTSLFIYHNADGIADLLLCVDDIVLTASSPQLLQWIISSFQQEFAMKDLGKLHHFLGVTVVTPVFPKKTKCKPICMPASSFMHIVDISK
jgi:hypothetical protein